MLLYCSDQLKSSYCFSPKKSAIVGFNSETLEYNGISFRVWDVGGQGEVAHVSAAVLFLHSSTSVCSTYCAWHSDYHFDLQLRPLLRHYLYGVQGVVFVVDSSDREWILRAKDLLNIILDEVVGSRILPGFSSYA